MKNYFLLLPTLLFLIACGGEKENPKSKNGLVATQSNSYINRPSGGRNHVWGSTIEIELNFRKAIDNLDSVYFYVDNNVVYSSREKQQSYLHSLIDSSLTLGTHQIKTVVITSDGEREEQYQNFTLISDQEPIQYNCSVISKFPHSTSSYTQGLEFSAGVLYEGTGLRGQSQLYQIDKNSGKAIKNATVPDNLFGEGITILNNKIYQLTYQARKGFIWDKASFEQLGQFNYSTEGWGLCNDGKNLIYSDGSHKLYFLDPENFKVLKTLEVYDNRSAITRLNELEYINGEIWANVYTTDEIVRIDPKTGKVLGKINCSGLLQPNEYSSDTDVLNGIAYDKQSNKIFITGKNWPWLFEIKIIEKSI